MAQPESQDLVTTPLVSDVIAPTSRRQGAFRRLLRKPLGLVSLTMLILLTLTAIFGPLYDQDPNFSALSDVNAAPGSAGHPLGADQYGRDILARLLASLNVSLISGLIGAGISTVIGTVFGLISGYTGKRTDAVTSWVFNLVMTFPALVLVLVLYPLTGGSYQVMMVIFGVFLSPGTFRLVRNLVIVVRNELYVDAARVAGLSNFRILSRHVLYVIRGPLIISVAFLASTAIGVQAGLAFLGLGSTLVPSFGAMTSDAFANVYREPAQLVWPTLGLALLTGSIVLLGNAVRDVLMDVGVVTKSAKRTTRAENSETPAAATAEDDIPHGGLLALRNLEVSYTQPDGSERMVVRGVSLDVKIGEVVGLVGESGSGKTQTAFAILGLLPPEARVRADLLSVGGEPISLSDPAAMRGIRGGVVAYIPQEPMSNLDPSFTIGSQLVEGLTAGMSKREAKATILALLERVGISDPIRTFRSYPHQISGGMAQRVLIAGAVAGRPKLLIADEPTTALDVTIQAEILDLLRDLQGELGMGVLLVTHNFGVVADLCDRVIVMQSGQVVETGDVRAVFASPQHPYTQELVGAILDEDTVRSDPPQTPEADLIPEGRK